MQRKARTYATSAALAMVLAGGLTACTGSSDDGGDDTKPGGVSTSAPEAEPGKYHTLPEPCGAVSLDTLKKGLPGAEGTGAATGSGTDGATASPYEGEATVTYDTDRRVGCRWKSATTLGTRHLSVDLERVVSYDAAVSDDDQAEELYDKRSEKSGISPSDAPSDAGKPTESGKPGEDGQDKGQSTTSDKNSKAEQGGVDEQGGRSKQRGQSEKGDTGVSPGPSASSSPGAGPDPGSDSGSDSDSAKSSDAGDEGGKGDDSSPSASPGPEDDLSPRALDGIGNTAFIDDELATGDSGVHRDITLVFRTSNVIATVEYDQWATDKSRVPDSQELQEVAQKVAGELAEHFDDD